MTLREALSVFMNYDGNEKGKGGREADKKVKKVELGDRRPRRSKSTTYGGYDASGNPRLTVDDSALDGRPPLPHGY